MDSCFPLLGIYIYTVGWERRNFEDKSWFVEVFGLVLKAVKVAVPASMGVPAIILHTRLMGVEGEVQCIIRFAVFLKST